MILCLTGLPGSGKSTAAEIFTEMGFEVIEGSTVIKEEMRKSGIEVTPESVEAFASKMKSERGKDYFAVITGKLLKSRDDGKDLLILGMRSVSEFDAVEAALGIDIPLIVVTLPDKARFDRLSHRRVLPIKSMDTMVMRDRSNLRMGIGELFDRVDYMISNSGTKRDLEESIRELLESMKEE